MSNDWKKLKLDEEERCKTEQSLRENWCDNSICMVELIRAEYDASKESDRSQTYESGPQVEELNQRSKKSKEYFVIIDYDIDLDWIADSSLKTDLFEAVIAKMTIVKSIPHNTLNIKQKLEFMRLLGNALVAAINEKRDEAQILLDEARKYVIRRLSEYSRKWTLLTATLLLFIFFIINLILANLEWNFTYPDLWEGIISGIYGAYLSIAFKAGKEQKDAEAGIWLHIINAVVKFSCAALFGYVGVLLLKNGHYLPKVVYEIGIDTNGAQLIGFLCGFSEKFIPNLIDNLSMEK